MLSSNSYQCTHILKGLIEWKKLDFNSRKFSVSWHLEKLQSTAEWHWLNKLVSFRPSWFTSSCYVKWIRMKILLTSRLLHQIIENDELWSSWRCMLDVFRGGEFLLWTYIYLNLFNYLLYFRLSYLLLGIIQYIV